MLNFRTILLKNKIIIFNYDENVFPTSLIPYCILSIIGTEFDIFYNIKKNIKIYFK